MTACIRFPLVFTVGVFLAACGSDESSGDSGDAGPDTGAGDKDATSSCTTVTSVSGSVIGENSAPIAGVQFVLCVYDDDSAWCLNPESSNSRGEFSTNMLGGSACLYSASYHLGPTSRLLTPLYCRVDVSSGGAIRTLAPDRLVSVDNCARDDLGDANSLHTVSAPDGIAMEVVPAGILLVDFAYEDLRLRRWNSADWGWPCFIDAENVPQALAVFAPEIGVIAGATDALHVLFPNDAGLAAGTVVDLYALGGAATLNWNGDIVGEGLWEIVGEAEVTSDGSTIRTRPGAGLPFGTWVGWKQK